MGTLFGKNTGQICVFNEGRKELVTSNAFGFEWTGLLVSDKGGENIRLAPYSLMAGQHPSPEEAVAKFVDQLCKIHDLDKDLVMVELKEGWMGDATREWTIELSKKEVICGNNPDGTSNGKPIVKKIPPVNFQGF